MACSSNLSALGTMYSIITGLLVLLVDVGSTPTHSLRGELLAVDTDESHDGQMVCENGRT